ncbi:hypothetical protein DAPPUDRAFT_311218 [Daphnia pulex]|uniref:Uncharacterized protein n=1 Tax=Daphnia pulex TaxID=6669 RepID=E9FV08_DAPPU|nr:hypothetical protein DAPPUDRAFT_311218 [Daphnia pulex]|eukprot:EFX88825.1 hypothetical protein DAPPUDRAFT_311218 [Daphnia pulex]
MAEILPFLTCGAVSTRCLLDGLYYVAEQKCEENRKFEMVSMVSLMFELSMVLLFGVKWVCSHFPLERCGEMELRQTCSSTSYFNVLFPMFVSVSVELLGKTVNVVWWLSGIFYRLNFVDMSSLATCTGVEFNRLLPFHRLDPLEPNEPSREHMEPERRRMLESRVEVAPTVTAVGRG